jgi:hypothetical protein
MEELCDVMEELEALRTNCVFGTSCVDALRGGNAGKGSEALRVGSGGGPLRAGKGGVPFVRSRG